MADWPPACPAVIDRRYRNFNRGEAFCRTGRRPIFLSSPRHNRAPLPFGFPDRYCEKTPSRIKLPCMSWSREEALTDPAVREPMMFTSEFRFRLRDIPTEIILRLYRPLHSGRIVVRRSHDLSIPQVAPPAPTAHAEPSGWRTISRVPAPVVSTRIDRWHSGASRVDVPCGQPRSRQADAQLPVVCGLRVVARVAVGHLS